MWRPKEPLPNDYLHKQQAIFDTFFKVEGIVEKLELENCLVGQPATVDLFRSLNNSKCIERIHRFAVSLDSSRFQMSFPSPHMHHVVTDLGIDRGDKVTILNVNVAWNVNFNAPCSF